MRMLSATPTLGIVIMASGASTRFKSNKLYAPLNGLPLYLHTLISVHQAVQLISDTINVSTIVVSCYPSIRQHAHNLGFHTVSHPRQTHGVSSTINRGIQTLDAIGYMPNNLISQRMSASSFFIRSTHTLVHDMHLQNTRCRMQNVYDPRIPLPYAPLATLLRVPWNAYRPKIHRPDAYLFCVADQPSLCGSTIAGFITSSFGQIKSISRLKSGMRFGNPTLFNAAYRTELLNLTDDKGGRYVIAHHMNDIYTFEVDPCELIDIDTTDDLMRMNNGYLCNMRGPHNQIDRLHPHLPPVLKRTHPNRVW